MANTFSKEERVAFEDIMEGFNDALVLSKIVSNYRVGDTQMERSGDVIWRPQPYVAVAFSGTDMTSNFTDYAQLSVPATLGFSRSVPWQMTAQQLRDALQEKRLGDAARQKLASVINVAIMNTAASEGTLVVKRTVAATGYVDVAEADALMNETGVSMDNRYMALSSRDYNGMASNLASRGTMQGKPNNAYERSLVGMVAGFQTHKLDYANASSVAAGTTVTVNGNQYHEPDSTTTVANGSESNKDNRSMTLALTVGGGTVAVDDCFTIAGCNAVHHITKTDTGNLKTFRILEILSGAGGTGNVRISPPIISDTGGTDAGAEYKNVTAQAATGSALVFLNTVAARYNPFWHKDALEILPGRYAIPANAGAQVLRGATDSGIELVMTKQFDINTLQTKYRLDTLFGVVCKQPEMAGIMLFSQT